MSKAHQQIAILDFGSQYAHLIARRFRQLGVLAKLYSPTSDLSKVENLIGIVLSGGPGMSDEQCDYNHKVFNLNVPIMGLCYGHYIITQHFGGEVKGQGAGEYGLATFQVGQSILFEGLEGGEVVWMSHGDTVIKLPEGFKIIGSTIDSPIAAMANEEKKIFGLQFHPEVTHTVHGMTIMKNFAYKICGAIKDWQIEDWQNEIIKQIKGQVKDNKVFLLVSGGVDSTVCFALLEKALGQEKVYGLHVDTGLMRKNEVEQVKGALSQAGFKNLHIKDASDQFFKKLKGVIHPEEKRKTIGKLFLDIQEQELEELNLNPKEWLLSQGTIYPDTIETGGTKHAAVIKTHHNRVARARELIEQGRVIEPIRDLYKDEVRELGESLGLSEKIVWRHPFPGPGLGIRVLCHSGQADISEKEIKEISKKLAEVKKLILEDCQFYVLPIRSVGVQGDQRTYAHPALLEYPISKSQFPRLPSASSLANGGQANKSQFPNPKIQNINWQLIEKLSPQITNSVKEVNRVLLRVDSRKLKVEGGELIKASVTKGRLELLREIDAIVQEAMFKAKLEKDIWQFPVVLIPFGIDGKESVVLRPVSSLEAMTARFYPIAKEVLESMIAKIEKLNQTSFIFYDVTNKPPGTIEWE